MKLSAKKVIGIVAVCAAVLVIGAISTIWIMFPPAKIKAMIIPEVEKALSRKVTVEKAGITIFPVLGVSLSGVEISNSSRSSFSEEPFVSLDKFLVQISFASIFKGYPEISKVILHKPKILVETDSSGAFNFDDMPIMAKDTTKKKKTSMPVLPVPISLKTFSIEKGSIIYKDNKGKQEFIIGDVNQKISLHLDKELKNIKTTGNLVLNQISVKTKEIEKPLSNLKLTLNHDVKIDLISGKAEISQLRLSLQKLFFNLTGSVTNFNDTPELDLTMNTDPIQINDILSEIPAEIFPDIKKLTGSGIANIGLTVKGALKDSGSLPINGKLSLKDVMVKYTSLPKAINNLNADCNFTDTSVVLNSLKMNFGDNPIALHASFINFKHPFVDLAILAKLKLEDIKDVIELPKGVKLSGNAAVDVNAKGEADPADPTKLDVKGTLDLSDLSVLWPPLVKPALINGRFTLSSKAIGQNLSVKIGQSSLTMNAAITNYLSMVFADSTKKLPRPTVDFTLKSPLLNVDEFMPPSKEPVSNGSTSPKQPENTPLIAPLPGVDMKGTISAQKIIYQKVEMDNMNMRVNVIQDIADISIKSGFANGTIDEQIHADLHNTSNISFNNKLTVKDVQINDLMGRFGGFIQPTNALNREVVNIQNSLFGKVSLNSSISGHGGTQAEITKSLTGDVTASVGEGKIVNSKILDNIAGKVEKFVKIGDLQFRDLKAIMHIENEQVQFNSFHILSSLGDWDIKGTTSFSGNLKMDVANKLTKEISGTILSVQNSGKNLAKSLLKNTKFANAASSLIDNTGVPSDKEGRVTLKMNLGGTISDPHASFRGFGEGENKSETASKPSPKKQATEQIQNMISEKKEDLEKKAQEEKAKIEQEAKQKLAEEKATLEAQQEQLKSDAKKALKKFFK